LLPFAWRALRQEVGRYWSLRWQIVGTALTGLAGFNLLIYLGLHSTTASNALLLNSMIPVLIALFGAVFYGQRLSRHQGAGVALSCVGVLVIISHGRLGDLLGLQFSGGDLIVFIGMVCFALYSLWLRAFPKDMNRVGLLAAQLIVAVVALFPGFVWECLMGHTAVWTRSSLVGVGYVAIAASLLATFLYMAGVRRVGPSRAGLFIHLIPVYGAGLSSLLLGETIHVYHAVGLAAILAGIFFSNANSSTTTRVSRGEVKVST
jgi:drug/metabolite transporter (DMT)-like permease